MSNAAAPIEDVVALTTACARAKLAGEDAPSVKSRRKAALDYIDAHLGNVRLGADLAGLKAGPAGVMSSARSLRNF